MLKERVILHVTLHVCSDNKEERGSAEGQVM